MATILGIKKAKQEIRLDDSPDSPVYTLDLTSKSVIKKGKEVYSDFQRNEKILKRIEDGSEDPEDLATMNHFYEKTITTLLGPDAYKEITEFVADGEDVDDCDLIFLITPVVLYLLEQLGDVVTANNSQAVLKYARSKSAASGAI